MSLGTNYNNNQNINRPSGPSDITTYSDYRMNNAESDIDSTCLAPRFWKSNLCLSIYPRKNTGNDEVSFDTDNGVTIYLSHAKARILANELRNFLNDPLNYNGCGVTSGAAAITISNGVEYGKNTPVLTIRKVDDAGNVTSAFSYEFKQNYYFAIKNYDGKQFTSDYESYKNIEIEMLITLLEEFVKASTNAIAATVHKSAYTTYRIDNKLDTIAQALGVDLKNAGGNRKPYSNNSYFNSASKSAGGSGYPSSNSVSYGSATIDDIE